MTIFRQYKEKLFRQFDFIKGDDTTQSFPINTNKNATPNGAAFYIVRNYIYCFTNLVER